MNKQNHTQIFTRVDLWISEALRPAVTLKPLNTMHAIFPPSELTRLPKSNQDI